MSICRETYQGDEALAGLLSKHGNLSDINRAKAVIDGINAAGLDHHDRRWLDLVAPSRSPALDAQLEALRVERAAHAATDTSTAERVAELRAELRRHDLSGVLVPRADEYQNEYVPPCARRLAWLTSFTGSAGMAVVLVARAAIFVDGRYTIQVRQEVDSATFEIFNSGDTSPSEWLAQTVGRGDRIGIDPWLHTAEQIERFRAALARSGAELVEMTENPIDRVWSDRPTQPLGPVGLLPVELAGRPAAEKIATLAADLARAGTDAAVLTAPDSIAWLFNIRGADVEHTPLPLSYATLRAHGPVDWYVDERKLMPGVAAALLELATIHPQGDFLTGLDALGQSGARVLVDQSSAPAAVPARLIASGAVLVSGSDPCTLPKAIKNPVEIAGTRAAHRRDGVALTRFLAWLSIEAATGALSEIAASDRLEQFRREGEQFRDLSFPTISGSGPNGAIVHYRAAPSSDRLLRPGDLYLVDSGAQYLDGTTDVTRTVAIGEPNAEQRDRFTRVLKGHIALAMARFPVGTSGVQLDALARRPLWEAGLDYDHGTGHGVGHYLSVHEGPQRIAKLGSAVPLRPGMIVSNEPGYYKSGAYGIRIENLVVVTKFAIDGAERDMLGFETLTLAPIDRALVEVGLLTAAERAWLDAYHARVAAEIGRRLDGAERAWLDRATAPI